MPRPLAVIGAVAAAAGLSLASAPLAGAAVPRSFFGVMTDGPLLVLPAAQQDSEYRSMRRQGLGTVRFAIDHSVIQPYRRVTDVPASQRSRFSVVEGVPTDWTATDQLFLRAAANGLDVLPVVLGTPSWVKRNEAPRLVAAGPKDRGPYTRFVVALSRRYGPKGTFWKANPTVPNRPQRRWQLWNEPNLYVYWGSANYAKPYIALLRRAGAALKRVDPGAKIVLAGLVNRSWTSLGVLRRSGLKRSDFDEAAVHPFTRLPEDVVKIVDLFAAELRRIGRRIPLWADEVAWASREGFNDPNLPGFATSEEVQAERLAKLVGLLVAKRERYHLRGMIWSTWLTTDSGDSLFYYTGLRRVRDGVVTSKPALEAYSGAIARARR